MRLDVLVVCAGNIGRSPLAAVMLRRGIAVVLGVSEDHLESLGIVVRSAGTCAPVGHPASRRGVVYGAASGLDLSEHSASQLGAGDLAKADVIYCMDRDQLDAVTGIDPAALAKAQLLAGEGREIPDPHHENDAFFGRVAEQIERAVTDRIPELIDLAKTR